MSWEYLKTKPWGERYEIVADYLGDIADKVVLDLDCGEGNFRRYIKCKRYIANDINPVDDDSDMEFSQIPDTEVDVACDVLCLFGYAGGEYTGTECESNQAANTVIRLADTYHPKHIILETVQKFEDDYQSLSKLVKRLPNYKVGLDTIIHIDTGQMCDLASSYIGNRHIIALVEYKQSSR